MVLDRLFYIKGPIYFGICGLFQHLLSTDLLRSVSSMKHFSELSEITLLGHRAPKGSGTTKDSRSAKAKSRPVFSRTLLGEGSKPEEIWKFTMLPQAACSIKEIKPGMAMAGGLQLKLCPT